MEIKNINLTKIDKKLLEYLKQRFPNKKTIYLSKGWIDSHVHLFEKSHYKINKENYHHLKGIVAAIDAGSSGVNGVKEFLKQKTPFELFILANISPDGITQINELEKLQFNLKNHLLTLENPRVVGTKVRLSYQSINGDHHSFKKPMKEVACFSQKPIMYHVGHMEQEDFDFLQKNLRSNDIVTHFFHGKNDFIYNALDELANKKIIKDVGWGSASFSFKTAYKMRAKNIWPDVISSDAHDGNIIIPNNRLYYYMSFFLKLGMPLNEIIEAVTTNPYQNLLKDAWNDYQETYTFFEIKKQKISIKDSDGNSEILDEIIVPLGIFQKGKITLC